MASELSYLNQEPSLNDSSMYSGYGNGKDPFSSYIRPEDKGISSATQQGIGEVAGGLGQIGASVIQSNYQNAEIDAARRESRQIAETNRQDELDKANYDTNMRKKVMDIDAQTTKLNQTKSAFQLRHDRFMYELKKNLENMQSTVEDAQTFDPVNKMNMEENILNIFGGKK